MTDTNISIAQALYTWARISPTEAGYRFTALSPGLQDQQEWLEASAGTLTSFVGNLEPSTQQREFYKPVGRHVSGSMALAYRKEDAGLDGYQRGGNYIVHILKSNIMSLSLSDTLRIPDSLWISVAKGRLNSTLELLDIALSDFRYELGERNDVVVGDTARLLQAVHELAQKRRISVSGWSKTEILALLGVMPAWADYAATLLPKWSERGPQQSLELASVNLAFAHIDDRRCVPVDPDLDILRRELHDAASIADMRSILVPKAQSSPRVDHEQRAVAKAEATAEPLGTEDASSSLEAAVRKWIIGSVKDLTTQEVILIEREPGITLATLDSIRQQIPSSRKPDSITVSILERCGDVDPRLLIHVLPIENESVAACMAFCNNEAVLEAVVRLNNDRSRTIDITLNTAIPFQRLVERSKSDTEVYEGLIRSLQISSLGSGSFARRLLLAKDVDFGYLYSQVVPSASAGRDDALLSLSCINPEEFVNWLRMPEPYGRALVNALRPETREKTWERMSRFVRRWRKH